MIVALTGHRPEDCASESEVREKLRASLDPVRIGVVISGMAAGVDLWGADEARKMGIPVWAARPWAGHSARAGDEQLYASIVVYADMVVNVDESKEFPGAWAYHNRNHWMVDHATHVLAYLNPNKKSGGTYQCVKYARSVGRPVRNVY